MTEIQTGFQSGFWWLLNTPLRGSWQAMATLMALVGGAGLLVLATSRLRRG